MASAVNAIMSAVSRVVTVIDTGVALGLAPMPAEARRAVITRLDGHHYAVLVEALEAAGPETAAIVAAAAGLVGRGLSEPADLGGSTRSTVLRARTADGARW